MEESYEPLNDLCVVVHLVHPILGVLLSGEEGKPYGPSVIASVDREQAWPEALQEAFEEELGAFQYEIGALVKMETIHVKELWDEPKYALFVVCHIEEEIHQLEELPGKKWVKRTSELERLSYADPSFREVALYAIKKHYPNQLQFTL